MPINPRKYNWFTFFKLPAAWWCGVRLQYLDDQKAITTVKYGWRNQNPFKSMFWAVQGMAAEFSTGVLVTNKIRERGKAVSMLVASNKAVFSKKAIGKITFTCTDGQMIQETLDKTIATGEGQTLWMRSEGVNEEGIVVSAFDFEWTLKLREK
jgi:hypothetical protein